LVAAPRQSPKNEAEERGSEKQWHCFQTSPIGMLPLLYCYIAFKRGDIFFGGGGTLEETVNIKGYGTHHSSHCLGF